MKDFSFIYLFNLEQQSNLLSRFSRHHNGDIMPIFGTPCSFKAYFLLWICIRKSRSSLTSSFPFWHRARPQYRRNTTAVDLKLVYFLISIISESFSLFREYKKCNKWEIESQIWPSGNVLITCEDAFAVYISSRDAIAFLMNFNRRAVARGILAFFPLSEFVLLTLW